MYKSTPLQTKGRGGGKFINCYTLAKKFQPYLDAWMANRERLGVTSEWLFVSPDNPEKQLTPGTLNSWANTFSRMTGRDFYWHALRHLFTTSLVRAGIPDSVITQIVGWESADMCRLYTDIGADEQIAAYFKNGEISAPEKKSIKDI